MLDFAANCSTLFRNYPFLQRFEQAHLAGFALVECWWPFGSATPSADQVAAFVDSVGAAEVSVACMNLFAGDLAAGERGILNDPSRIQEFRTGVHTAAAISAATACRRFNALYGLSPSPANPAWQSCAMSNLAFACEVLATVDAELMLEPLCRNDRYGLRDPLGALTVCRQLQDAGHENAGLLADLYQLAATGGVDVFLRDHMADIRHVQVADAPGRGAPGTGELPITDWLAAIELGGYAGVIGLEYFEIAGVASFDWLPG